MIVKPAIMMFRAISFGVFWRSAPSTSAIIRSRNVSPGFEVILILTWSERTRVPPVTALRSPPDSRITGALSPVITDSSTVAIAFDDLAVSGNDFARAADHDIAGPQLRRRDLLDPSALSEPVGDRVGLGLAQRFGLRLAARFGHRFGEGREQHREPEPQIDLQLESDRASAGRRCRE